MALSCFESRALLRRGALPGRGRGRNSQLGYHLELCAPCRTLSPTTLRFNSGAARGSTFGAPVYFARRRRRIGCVARLLLAFSLVLSFGIGWAVGGPLLDTWDNLQAMSRLPAPRAPLQQGSRADAPDRLILARLDSAPTKPAPTIGNAPAQLPAIAPASTVTPTAEPTLAPTPTPTAEPTPAAPGALTVLLLGLDRRANEGELARSDTIVIARLDPASQRVALLSLPRDLWVPIPGVGWGKINSAYFIGQQAGQGAALARDTVSQLLGIPIDYTAVVDFAGFRGLVDSLGGINVDVPRELYDGQYPTEDYGYTVAHFLPGPQTMNGDQALMYSRIRHPDSDFERMRRQQEVLLAVARKVRERGIVRNLLEANQLTAALQPYVRTDMPPATALRLLWSMRGIDPAGVRRNTADLNQLQETYIGGGSALIDTGGVLRQLGAELITAP